MTPQSQPKIGMALSGGGVRGLAHIGILQAFKENGIEISHFSGASAGALVGVMAAARCGIQKMLDFWTETDPFRVSKLGILEAGLFNSVAYVDDIKKYVKVETFEELPLKLSVAVSAMLSGTLKIIDSGPLWPIVVASASFPIMFSPVAVEDEMYMDGGILDNFPVEPLKKDCDLIIGVNVAPHKVIEKEDLDSFRDVIERVMDLRYHADRHDKRELCDVLICPDKIDTFGVFETDAMLDIYQLGYQAGLKAAPEILEKIESWKATVASRIN